MTWLFSYGQLKMYGGIAYIWDPPVLVWNVPIRSTIEEDYDFKFGITDRQYLFLVGLIGERQPRYTHIKGGYGYGGLVKFGRQSIGLISEYDCIGLIVDDRERICDEETYDAVRSALLDFGKRNITVRSMRSRLFSLAFYIQTTNWTGAASL